MSGSFLSPQIQQKQPLKNSVKFQNQINRIDIKSVSKQDLQKKQQVAKRNRISIIFSLSFLSILGWGLFAVAQLPAIAPLIVTILCAGSIILHKILQQQASNANSIKYGNAKINIKTGKLLNAKVHKKPKNQFDFNKIANSDLDKQLVKSATEFTDKKPVIKTNSKQIAQPTIEKLLQNTQINKTTQIVASAKISPQPTSSTTPTTISIPAPTYAMKQEISHNWNIKGLDKEKLDKAVLDAIKFSGGQQDEQKDQSGQKNQNTQINQIEQKNQNAQMNQSEQQQQNKLKDQNNLTENGLQKNIIKSNNHNSFMTEKEAKKYKQAKIALENASGKKFAKEKSVSQDKSGTNSESVSHSESVSQEKANRKTA